MPKSRRRMVSAVVAAVASVAGMAAAAAPATAAAGYNFVTPSGTSCLDGYDKRPVSEVYTTGCNGGDFQRWKYLGFNTKTYLYSYGAVFCIKKVGSAVTLDYCNSADSNVYWLVQGRTGSLVIRSFADPNVCLTRAGTNVDVGPCNVPSAAWAVR
ncbi:hypothetical protein [Amycolatopsis sp. NPDC098790]|uniref:hypothetical protein n=1 Tax=Amycolatopsis sp. NPDC098790 TaxID=3363939 RepID=UPI003806F489